VNLSDLATALLAHKQESGQFRVRAFNGENLVEFDITAVQVEESNKTVYLTIVEAE
jgi:hypothetical protein